MSQALASSQNALAAHAVCAAAGLRDGLRAAQFYARDLANADGRGRGEDRQAPYLSRVVGQLARLTDRFFSWGARTSIALFLPSWRNLPSPFDARIIDEVTQAISLNSLIHNPRFNAYFFRAAGHILEHYCDKPSLVLEHRVDAARRHLALNPPQGGHAPFLSRTLIALVRHGAIARTGPVKAGHQFFGSADPNVSVFAIACIALMLASEGRPTEAMDEDEFFEVTGALIGPRLPRIAELVTAGDEAGLAAELADIRAMY